MPSVQPWSFVGNGAAKRKPIFHPPDVEHDVSTKADSLVSSLARARDASDLERLRIAAVQTGHVAFHWDLTSDLMSWSKAASDVLGVNANGLPERERAFNALLESEDRERREAYLVETVQVDDGSGIEYDLGYRLTPCAGCEPVALEERGRLLLDEDGNVRHVVAIVRRAVSFSNAPVIAGMIDPETALASKLAVIRALDEAVGASEQTSRGPVLATTSNIRDISETYGPKILPEVIRATGARLRTVMRGADVLGCTGPAQFGIMLRECSSEQILTAGDRFVAAIRNEVIETTLGPVWVELTAGAVTVPSAASSASEAFTLAEEALDQATVRVGPSFVAYEPSLARHIMHQRNRQSAIDIVAAFNEERFTLWYQPIVDAADHKPVFYESLLRMKSAAGEIVPAVHLVPIAEKLGFMQMIDAIVCRTSLQLAASKPGTMINFDLSDSTLRNGYAVERLLSFVAEAGDVAKQICVEISHAAAARQISDQSQSNELQRLREMGCQIAMNGYLTDGMSISILQMVDIVKLDGSVCAGISKQTDDFALIKAAVEFAHRAGVKVVAEHIETEQDAATMAEAGVDYLQGYLFGSASPDHFNRTLAPLQPNEAASTMPEHDRPAQPVVAPANVRDKLGPAEAEQPVANETASEAHEDDVEVNIAQSDPIEPAAEANGLQTGFEQI